MTPLSALMSVLVLTSVSVSTGSLMTDDLSSANAQAKPQAVTHTTGCIAIHQESGGPVHFEVFLMDPIRQLVPIKAYRISVQIQGRPPPIWEAESENYSSAHRITYGVTPKGFQEQIHPEHLLPGVSYRVLVRSYALGGVQRVFLHEGAEKKNTCPWDGNPSC